MCVIRSVRPGGWFTDRRARVVSGRSSEPKRVWLLPVAWSLLPKELARLKPQVTVETVWKCRECRAARPVPAHLVVELQREDSWSGLGDLLLVSCGRCGQQGAAAHASVLVEAGGTDGRPGYLLLPVEGTPSSVDVDKSRRFLVENHLPPVLVAGLVPTGWPAADADLDSSVLSMFEADPAIASQAASYDRRHRVMDALVRLGAVTSPGQIREALRACPELVTGGVDAEHELRSILNWPPEAPVSPRPAPD